MTTADLLCAARAVKPAAAALSTAEKNRLLEAMAQALLDHADNILAANAADVEAARGVISLHNGQFPPREVGVPKPLHILRLDIPHGNQF